MDASVCPPVVEQSELVALCVGDDSSAFDRVRTALADQDDLEVRVAPSPDEALDQLGGVDCVVVGFETVAAGRAFLDSLRDRRPTLPVVVHATSADPDVTAAIAERPLVDCLPSADAAPLVAPRARRLVERRRLSDALERACAALDSIGAGVAVTDTDGRFEFVTRAYASRFGYEPDDLRGEHWRVCHPDDEIERLETSALPSVRDDWQWTGRFVGRRADGETFSASVRIAGCADGGLLFVYRDEGHGGEGTGVSAARPESRSDGPIDADRS